MAERQIEHRKSCLVLSARFPVVNWRSRPVAKSAGKSAYYQGGVLRKDFVAKRLLTYNDINHAGGLRLTLPVSKQLLYLQFQNSQHTKS